MRLTPLRNLASISCCQTFLLKALNTVKNASLPPALRLRKEHRPNSEEAIMDITSLETAIEAAWDARDTITPTTGGETREAIEATLNALDLSLIHI